MAQEFELCDHEQMLGYMAYHGMPAHYPHWSYGKGYERQKTLYDHGVAGLPYEMVINSDPCLAYLMRGNSLGLHVLTMAHVYGHNDFFANSFSFRATEPRQAIARAKARADRVRDYVEDPSIGLEAVEQVLDAAHALSLQCRRNQALRKLSPEEQKGRALSAALEPQDPYRRIHKKVSVEAPDLERIPLEPEEDLLLFIRDYNPRLADWQKDLLGIVHAEAQYFSPQMQTKVMNEGWATYWHWRIMNSLELPHDLHLEFLVRHNQVIRPIAGDINPYHLGFNVWREIAGERENQPGGSAREPVVGSQDALLFEIRATDRDVSFLRRFLTKDLIRDLGLFEYARTDSTLVATKVADDEGWEDIKATLLRTVGTGGVPVIKVVDGDEGRRGVLLLRHEHDGRDLEQESAAKTLAHLYRLWDRQVVLETVLDGSACRLTFDDDGFALEPSREMESA